MSMARTVHVVLVKPGALRDHIMNLTMGRFMSEAIYDSMRACQPIFRRRDEVIVGVVVQPGHLALVLQVPDPPGSSLSIPLDRVDV
jgi:hypothetical protein